MQRLKMFEPLQVESFEEDSYHLPVHNHTYFEIIYIYSGSGLHRLNSSQLSYKAGDLFMIAPEDEHRFEIGEKTRFIFIKFTDAYFRQGKYIASEDYFSLEPLRMMRHPYLKEQTLKFGADCQMILKNIMDNILSYSCRKDWSTSAIVFHQILSVFALVKETVAKAEGHFVQSDIENNHQMLGYIHENIYVPDKLQIKEIATHFHIAPNYFSAYFKREFLMSYREYLNHYKSRLIERRVRGGEMTLKQIAAEFGFTDESHLSRFFKNHFQVTPKEYREGVHA